VGLASLCVPAARLELSDEVNPLIMILEFAVLQYNADENEIYPSYPGAV
jgi:hypothetical protein